jgi:hypothetical protein
VSTSVVLKERRLKARKKLTGLLPGRMVNMSTERPISCRPIDISDFGLGILTADELPMGTQLVLVLPQKSVKFKVVWVAEDFGKNNLKRYGLASEEQDVNVEVLFTEAGCLK